MHRSMLERLRKRHCGKQLHRRAKRLAHPPTLLRSQPKHTRAFDGPDRRRESPIECERHGERRENERERRVAERQPLSYRLRAATHEEREQHINRTRDHRRNCRAVFVVRHELRLQCKAHDGCAKDQHAVERFVRLARMAQRVEQADQHVDHEERDEKRLRRGVMRWVVFQNPPQRRDKEGRHEAEQIQHTPRAEPRDDADRDVEQQVVREEGHVIALAGRKQNRRRERTRETNERKRLFVLQQREQCGERTHKRHQQKSSHRCDERIKFERGKHGQVQHRHAQTLQQHRVVIALHVVRMGTR